MGLGPGMESVFLYVGVRFHKKIMPCKRRTCTNPRKRKSCKGKKVKIPDRSFRCPPPTGSVVPFDGEVSSRSGFSAPSKGYNVFAEIKPPPPPEEEGLYIDCSHGRMLLEPHHTLSKDGELVYTNPGYMSKDAYCAQGGVDYSDVIECEGGSTTLPSTHERIGIDTIEQYGGTALEAQLSIDQYCRQLVDHVRCNGKYVKLPDDHSASLDGTYVNVGGKDIPLAEYCTNPTDGPPPFIKELFPAGTVIEYKDGGVTTVHLSDGPCDLDYDDIFILLMIKEALPDRKSVVYSRISTDVYLRDGSRIYLAKDDLDELVSAYHSFWDNNGPLKNQLGQQGDKRNPEGYRAATYAFGAADKRMTGVLGRFGIVQPTVKALPAVGFFANVFMAFINWTPNPEGRPGQGKAAMFDKCGNQIGMGNATSLMEKGEVVYLVSDFGGEPEIFNKLSGYDTKYPITDWGCYYGELKIKHPTPRALNHPDAFICMNLGWSG